MLVVTKIPCYVNFILVERPLAPETVQLHKIQQLNYLCIFSVLLLIKETNIQWNSSFNTVITCDYNQNIILKRVVCLFKQLKSKNNILHSWPYILSIYSAWTSFLMLIFVSVLMLWRAQKLLGFLEPFLAWLGFNCAIAAAVRSSFLSVMWFTVIQWGSFCKKEKKVLKLQ